MQLGSALRHLRKSKGFTLAEIAQKAGSHVGNLSRIERETTMPSLDLLYRIAASLEVKVSDVFSIVENREPDEQQLKLSSLYISLPSRDRALLLAFARLLQDREQQDMASIGVETVPLPVLFGESTGI